MEKYVALSPLSNPYSYGLFSDTMKVGAYCHDNVMIFVKGNV